MSREIAEDNKERTERILRRSKRNRKTVVSESSSSTESIGSEAETVVGWSAGTRIGVEGEESESIEGSE